MKFAGRIRRARCQADLSQTQLAALISVQRSAVSNWESPNDIYPTMANLIAIARACDVSFEWLGTGRGVMLLSGQEFVDTPTADAELVEEVDERALLAAFRVLPRRARELFLELICTIGVAKGQKSRLRITSKYLANGEQDHQTNQLS